MPTTDHNGKGARRLPLLGIGLAVVVLFVVGSLLLAHYRAERCQWDEFSRMESCR